MRPRMSVEDEWKSRLQGRREKAARSRAKGSCGLPPPDYRQIRSGSVATRSKPRTTGKHRAN